MTNGTIASIVISTNESVSDGRRKNTNDTKVVVARAVAEMTDTTRIKTGIIIIIIIIKEIQRRKRHR